MKNTVHLQLIPARFLWLVGLVMLSSTALAEQPAVNNPPCPQVKANADGHDTKHQCVDAKKRGQLKTVKRQPQVRSSPLDRQRDFDISKLYPFITGSGKIQ